MYLFSSKQDFVHFGFHTKQTMHENTDQEQTPQRVPKIQFPEIGDEPRTQDGKDDVDDGHAHETITMDPFSGFTKHILVLTQWIGHDVDGLYMIYMIYNQGIIYKM